MLSKNVISHSLILFVVSLLIGCASNPSAKNWKLPNKKNAESAMIIGRLDFPGNKTLNPGGDHLQLDLVAFRKKGEWYPMDGYADNFVMDNNYFVVPNLAPGKYYLYGFFADGALNGVQDEDSMEDGDFIDVKPGEIVFLGSLDYIKNNRSFLEKVKNTGTFQLKQARHPTELEMLEWLRRTGKGSGWEHTINMKIRKLGGH